MKRKWCAACLAIGIALGCAGPVQANRWWDVVVDSIRDSFAGSAVETSYSSSRSRGGSSSDGSFYEVSPAAAPRLPDQQEVAQRMLDLANQERAKVGAPPLHLDQAIVNAANVRARELTVRFSHTRPDGSSCEKTIPGKLLGENIAAGNVTVEETFNGWMHSDGHRRNILRPEYTGFGAAVCYDPDTEYKYYWVQLFELP